MTSVRKVSNLQESTNLIKGKPEVDMHHFGGAFVKKYIVEMPITQAKYISDD